MIRSENLQSFTCLMRKNCENCELKKYPICYDSHMKKVKTSLQNSYITNMEMNQHGKRFEVIVTYDISENKEIIDDFKRVMERCKSEELHDFDRDGTIWK